MTKDGRPSLMNDIRYFASDIHKYLDDHDVTAFGRRLAWWLNGEELSLGSYTALYIYFSPTITNGAIHVTDYGGDWWQRYTYVGVPGDFPNVQNAKEIAIDGTIAALKAIRPDKVTVIDQAAEVVKTNSDQTRFLIKTKERKDYRIDIAISIGVWRNPSYFHVSLTDKETGEFLDAPAIPILFPDHGFDLAGSVSLIERVVHVKAHPSFTANRTAAQYEWPPSLPVSTFTKVEEKPVYSKLVRRRG